MRKFLTAVAVFAYSLYITITLRKGEKMMADIYVGLIVYGRRTIDDIPERFREAVLADLTEMHVDGYGNPV